MTMIFPDPSHPLADAPRLKIYPLKALLDLPQVAALGEEARFEMRVVGSVLAVRANAYIIEELIDWSAVPDDPIYKLVFPRREMLGEQAYGRVADALRRNAPAAELAEIVRAVRLAMNPHPAGQTTLNRPMVDGETAEGIQHKYDQTLLFFPSEGQTCHAYCTFCFRWPQFTGDKSLRMAATEEAQLVRYLRDHPEISDVLVTGGDPLIMKSRRIAGLLEALTGPGLEHVRNIRLGTKALSWWPHRFTTDPDAPELLAALRRVTRSGRHLAVMAHVNHPRELSTAAARQAVARLQETGAVIRSQSPLLRGINDDAAIWSAMWSEQVAMGIVPYYMFVVRDTGARAWFDVPLARAWEIHAGASRAVSGLARTARGPSMSTAAGKIEVLGVAEVGGERLFVLRFLQARRAEWAYRPFFARYDPQAAWIDDLVPAFGEERFFFEGEAAGGPA
ncbi:MAG: KamA family radical SAM protein [Allosphingosinicella sp.]